jgi:hypothetical protein
MSVDDPNSSGFSPAFATQEYSAGAGAPGITTLVYSYNPPINMQEEYLFVWHNTSSGGQYFTTSQEALLQYFEYGGQTYSGPNPVCPPMEQFAQNDGTYSPYYVGNWGESNDCPASGTPIS